jgi:hypothetical protein
MELEGVYPTEFLWGASVVIEKQGILRLWVIYTFGGLRTAPANSP